jgi:hypothetical protein
MFIQADANNALKLLQYELAKPQIVISESFL